MTIALITKEGWMGAQWFLSPKLLLDNELQQGLEKANRGCFINETSLWASRWTFRAKGGQGR